ncbi:MAG: hypothetical protein ACMXYE_03320 [Candidatus Woesearchaeota archaeon]
MARKNALNPESIEDLAVMNPTNEQILREGFNKRVREHLIPVEETRHPIHTIPVSSGINFDANMPVSSFLDDILNTYQSSTKELDEVTSSFGIDLRYDASPEMQKLLINDYNNAGDRVKDIAKRWGMSESKLYKTLHDLETGGASVDWRKNRRGKMAERFEKRLANLLNEKNGDGSFAYSHRDIAEEFGRSTSWVGLYQRKLRDSGIEIESRAKPKKEYTPLIVGEVTPAVSDAEYRKEQFSKNRQQRNRQQPLLLEQMPEAEQSLTGILIPFHESASYQESSEPPADIISLTVHPSVETIVAQGHANNGSTNYPITAHSSSITAHSSPLLLTAAHRDARDAMPASYEIIVAHAQGKNGTDEIGNHGISTPSSPLLLTVTPRDPREAVPASYRRIIDTPILGRTNTSEYGSHDTTVADEPSQPKQELIWSTANLEERVHTNGSDNEGFHLGYYNGVGSKRPSQNNVSSEERLDGAFQRAREKGRGQLKRRKPVGIAENIDDMRYHLKKGISGLLFKGDVLIAETRRNYFGTLLSDRSVYKHPTPFLQHYVPVGLIAAAGIIGTAGLYLNRGKVINTLRSMSAIFDRPAEHVTAEAQQQPRPLYHAPVIPLDKPFLPEEIVKDTPSRVSDLNEESSVAQKESTHEKDTTYEKDAVYTPANLVDVLLRAEPNASYNVRPIAVHLTDGIHQFFKRAMVEKDGEVRPLVDVSDIPLLPEPHEIGAKVRELYQNVEGGIDENVILGFIDAYGHAITARIIMSRYNNLLNEWPQSSESELLRNPVYIKHVLSGGGENDEHGIGREPIVRTARYAVEERGILDVSYEDFSRYVAGVAKMLDITAEQLIGVTSIANSLAGDNRPFISIRPIAEVETAPAVNYLKSHFYSP